MVKKKATSLTNARRALNRVHEKLKNGSPEAASFWRLSTHTLRQLRLIEAIGLEKVDGVRLQSVRELIAIGAAEIAVPILESLATSETESEEIRDTANAGLQWLESMSHIPSFSSAQVLSVMEPEDLHRIYVLGCFDTGITVQSQQARALNLIRATVQAGVTPIGSTLAIIGAGAAGLTAAAAAATAGLHVELFEGQIRPLYNLSNCEHRHLHPHIYRWPEWNATQKESGLPILPWTAGRASDVAEQLMLRFEEVCNDATGSVKLHTSCRVNDVRPVTTTDGNRVVVRAKNGRSAVCDAAVLAVGFGKETNRFDCLDNYSYWGTDPLGDIDSGHGGLRVLISGNGDGALVDVCRAAFRNFDHEKTITNILSGRTFQQLGARLQAINLDYLQKLRTSSGKDAAIIHQLDIDFRNAHETLRQSLNDELANFVYSPEEREVWYNTSSCLYSGKTSLLNRAMVLCLVEGGFVRCIAGRLNQVARKEEKFEVSIDDERLGATPFDIVIPRHGPVSPFRTSTMLQAMDESCASLRGKIRELDICSRINSGTRSWYERLQHRD